MNDLNSKPLVLYHANCNDGFTAAWCAWVKFGGECEFVPVSYGQEPPDVAGRRVYILDFSYKRPTMLCLASRTSDMTILDHHKSAEEELDGLEDECSRVYGLIPPTVVFAMDKSGARLAWEHFFPSEEVPLIVAYTEDRDLWRFAMPHSREINSAISSYPHDFDQWDEINDRLYFVDKGVSQLVEQGKAIERHKTQQVDAICRNAREVDFDGVKVLAANTSVLFSEVAGRLAEGRPFGAAWFVRADGKRQWSLRSTNEGLDVSDVARRRGGGGHRNAAGFEEPAS